MERSGNRIEALADNILKKNVVYVKELEIESY